LAKQSRKTGSSAEEDLTQQAIAHIDRIVVFKLESQRYGLPIEKVQEIQQIVEFSRVPGADSSLIGMMNLRGQVIPVLDMRALIGLPAKSYHIDTPMIICHAKDALVSLVVDEVEDVLLIPPGALAPAPAVHNLSERLLGVCRMDGEMIFLFDVDRLVTSVDIDMGECK